MEPTNTTTAPPPGEIDVKKAVRIAMDYVRQVYELEIQNISLEEVQFSDDFQRSEWHITVGFDRTFRQVTNPLLAQLPVSVRVYKVVDVDAQTGKVKAMRMR